MIAAIRRHRGIAAGVALALAALAAVVLVWFQPQKLLIDERVEEAAVATGGNRPVVLGSGAFRSLAHATSGRAALTRLADGRHVLRIEDLRTDNGPDLRVYLSPHEASSKGDAFERDFVDLGALKGNLGSQNYEVPRGVDVSRVRSAVVWCRRFSVGFGVAPLA